MTLVNAINLKTGDVAEFDLINIKTSGNYKGLWDASINTPFLTNGVGTEGDWYEVSVGGTVNFGAGDFVFSEGDTVSYIDGSWEKASEKIIDDSQISYNKTWSSAKIKEEIDVQVPLIVEEKVEEGLVGKQDLLTEDQLKAVNSGITAEKVAGYDGLSTDINNLSTEVAINKTDIATLKTDVGDIGDSITDLRNDKQDKLTAGNNITITEDGVISATGGETGSNIASDITYDNATSGLTADNVQNAIDELSVEKLDNTTDVSNAGKAVVVGADGNLTFDNIIDDNDLTSTTSTLSASKVKEAVKYTVSTQDGKERYIKLRLNINTISVTDIYGGKIEIIGANNSAANPTYKTAKVVRVSYGDWNSYDATQVPSVVHAKIGDLYYYSTDNFYYLRLHNYASFNITGLASAPEIVSSLPAETSEMTLIPESQYASYDGLRNATKYAQGGSPFSEMYSNENPYRKLTVDCYYARPQTFIITTSNGYYGKLFVVMNGGDLNSTTVKVITENGTAPFEIKYDNAQALTGSGHYSVDVFIYKKNTSVVDLNIKPYIQSDNTYTKVYTADDFVVSTADEFTNATKTASISTEYATKSDLGVKNVYVGTPTSYPFVFWILTNDTTGVFWFKQTFSQVDTITVIEGYADLTNNKVIVTNNTGAVNTQIGTDAISGKKGVKISISMMTGDIKITEARPITATPTQIVPR